MYGTYPSTKFTAVTPSDTALLSYVNNTITGGTAVTLTNCRALYIGGAGDLAIKADNGQTITFEGVAAGTLLPISTNKVLAATTATSIIALF